MPDTEPSLQLNDAQSNGRPSLGTTRVANEVIAHIAALAALRVDGVHALYHANGQSIDRLVRRAHASRGVRVQLREGALYLDVWIAIDAGGNVPVIGAAVQRHVAEALDRMLDMRVGEVNVFVSEVIFR
jgi:uncharacterized alkaline shock family protein YloU